MQVIYYTGMLHCLAGQDNVVLSTPIYDEAKGPCVDKHLFPPPPPAERTPKYLRPIEKPFAYNITAVTSIKFPFSVMYTNLTPISQAATLSAILSNLESSTRHTIENIFPHSLASFLHES